MDGIALQRLKMQLKLWLNVPEFLNVRQFMQAARTSEEIREVKEVIFQEFTAHVAQQAAVIEEQKTGNVTAFQPK